MDRSWFMNSFRENAMISVTGFIAVGLASKLVYEVFNWNYKAFLNKDEWNKKGFKKIPVPPKKYLYFGHMLSLSEDPTAQVNQWLKTYGPILHLTMGVQHWVVIADPLLASEIFVRNASKSSGRQRHIFTHTIYADGAKGLSFTDSGKKWQKSRKIAQSMLSPERIEKFSGVIESITDNVVDELAKASNRDGSVCPLSFVKLSTFSIMLKSLFGKTVDSIDDPLLQDVICIADGIVKYISPEQDIGSFIPSFSWITKFSKQRKGMANVVKLRNVVLPKLVSEAAHGEVDCLVKQAYALKEEYGLDDDDLVSMMSDLLAAGGDPTSVSLTWLLLILAQYKDVQQRVCYEIDAFVEQNGRLPSFSDRENVPYIRAVLLECIRFRSITNFGIPRFVTEDIECLGYFIPKNTVVMTSMHAMHMYPNNQTDADQFIPERFLGRTKTWAANSRANVQERDMYVFGWGRRICVGIHLVEVEVFNMCVRALGRYNIEIPMRQDGLVDDIISKGSVSRGLNCMPHDYTLKFIKRCNTPLDAHATKKD
ncbi:hypothetical protein J3Q64DRAFT_1777377 [Phycomyces blakesleeanus]|uniref:CYP5206 protein n=2 Tax=Phycomyces blakesleeanus TaxID=4837 RepID=A0A163CUV7_PHYB8|nr:CYP5206 protein [Phycomyces blakesleeanus NRRL 1555(-)]OAD65750.1 CYP5206 protein [Phycomyces blakesleeanus NRRL 1555(-)]|eukprot:XP_018283790.1 CYP5206 protein [Phycomyces blakesleeanus NRRL 1555(-)]